ncbi:MAG: heliorhodopsin HeR [Burkholderiaceae bacterium]|nr:heliorhodopsin HeR [Microbacteriaceae bacterium]
MPIPEPLARERMLRRVGGIIGVLLALQAAAIIVILAVTGARQTARVTVDLAGAGRHTLTAVDLGPAVVTLLLIVAVFRALMSGPFAARYLAAVHGNRHTARWVEFSLTSSIIVFLVALLNGIGDVAGLVPLYALTSGMTLMSVLQERDIRFGHPRLALQFGAAIGIVPWGVIAFHEIGAGLLGGGPSVVVRVITLVTLAAALVAAVTQWREQAANAAGADPLAGERMSVVLSAATVSLFAWLVLLGVVLPD